MPVAGQTGPTYTFTPIATGIYQVYATITAGDPTTLTTHTATMNCTLHNYGP